jgi:hypothetical protein
MKKIDIDLLADFHWCECSKNCPKQATDKHHFFSKSRVNKKLYGKLLDKDINIGLYNNGCHLNKPKKKLSEKKFCEMLGIEPRSKVLKQKEKRDGMDKR